MPDPAKPMVRWWWLCGPFEETDIRRQLEWARANGFGGVELAWIYPSWIDAQESDRNRPRWLGTEWAQLTAYTKRVASELDLQCDFTFGSCWPFGGSQVRAGDAAQTFESLSRQRLRCSWEEGPQLVLDHLSREALGHYAEPLLAALKDALTGPVSALFCDSLELDTARLWSRGLDEAFEQRFGYALGPYIDILQRRPSVRYDYRKLVSEVIRREFYSAYSELCQANGAVSRVQCHGAPTDLLAAYAAVDIPESEALLFPPSFSRIAASAAAWRGKRIVTAEAFTCIYGFPGDGNADELWKREDSRDIRLLADALFANGVNRMIWHGMPYQPAGRRVEFYASVHVGPDSAFAAELAQINAYLRDVSFLMQSGESYAQLGVYLPNEDALMLDRIPEAQRTPGANYIWEMRHAAVPRELEGYQPAWISAPFLQEAEVRDGRIHSRELSLAALYVDCKWMDYESLAEFRRLAEEGARIIWRRRCIEPGFRKHARYNAEQEAIRALAYDSVDAAGVIAVVEGHLLSPFWTRRVGNDLVFFFAHPQTRAIHYPMQYQLGVSRGVIEQQVMFSWAGVTTPYQLRFEDGRSILLRLSATGEVQRVDPGSLAQDGRMASARHSNPAG